MRFDDRLRESCLTGHLRPESPSCRDKGRGGVDAGALCLSSLGCNPSASRKPNESGCHEDKHKAPTHLRIRPLSLQDGTTQMP
jgi:hypothetical protein